MSTATIEQLQRIVADDSRTAEERRHAAEHILKLQESDREPKEPEPLVDPAMTKRRAQFSGAQRRLADGLSRGQRNFNLIDTGRSDGSTVTDKLGVAQVIRLMLDD